MNKIGWKVVRRAQNGDFQSARIHKNWGWCVSYRIGERSVGCRGTPVLAFRTRASARDFQGLGDLVFKATLENPEAINRLTSWLCPEWFALFWERRAISSGSFSAPDGTLACDAITLLEPA